MTCQFVGSLTHTEEGCVNCLRERAEKAEKRAEDADTVLAGCFVPFSVRIAKQSPKEWRAQSEEFLKGLMERADRAEAKLQAWEENSSAAEWKRRAEELERRLAPYVHCYHGVQDCPCTVTAKHRDDASPPPEPRAQEHNPHCFAEGYSEGCVGSLGPKHGEPCPAWDASEIQGLRSELEAVRKGLKQADRYAIALQRLIESLAAGGPLRVEPEECPYMHELATRAHGLISAAERERDLWKTEAEAATAQIAAIAKVRDGFLRERDEARAEVERRGTLVAKLVKQMGVPLHPDWACRECVSGSDILIPGFLCPFHEGAALAASSGKETPDV